MNADDVLAALDPEQREVAANPTGPMCVLAGAGTGKTRAITHRIAYGVHSGAYQPARVLAVTFTARAAGEMRTRLRDLGLPPVQARTFHAAAMRQLGFFWPQVIGGAAPEVMSSKMPALGEAGGRLRLELDRTAMRDIASEIEWAKVSMLTPEVYPRIAAQKGRAVADLDHTATARLWEMYEEVKAERHVIDFEDVLLLMAGFLTERDDVARAFHNQYRHFVVDEYQDVNPIQQKLLDLWVGDHKDLCVVGDPAQTIYSFTGASAQHLLEFGARHQGARTVRLARNYRSTPQVLQVANAVLGAARSGGVELQSQKQSGPKVQLHRYDDDVVEAQAIAGHVEALQKQGVDRSQIAVLYRINAQSEAIETALAEADIPYLVKGGEQFFRRQEIKQALVLLRGAARSDDGSVPIGRLVRDVISGAGWQPERPSGGAMLDRWQSLEALATVADDLATTDPQTRLPDVIAELDRRASEQHAPAVEGVTLASLHAAKGLEWDAVILAGCSDGLLPLSHAEGAEAIEEERRLTYVGLTRARRHLVLTWAQARRPGGKPSRSVSRFLHAAHGVLDGVAPAAARTPSRGRRTERSRPATCRGCGVVLESAAERKIGRCVNCPATYDEATFEQLRTWRKAVADDQKVPAFVVFTDATLVAVAEREPSDLRELSGISGIGRAKLQTYGDAVLGVLAGQPVDAMVEVVAQKRQELAVD